MRRLVQSKEIRNLKCGHMLGTRTSSGSEKCGTGTSSCVQSVLALATYECRSQITGYHLDHNRM